MKKLQKSEKGFTIIEVLIVLAIAGLIMLIVFLAVPALQRNSRNTQRKNDVSALLGAVNEYTSNHSGSLPPDAAAVVSNAKLGYYSGTGTSAGQVTLNTTATGTLGTTSADDRIIIAEQATCNAAGTAIAGGSARQVAVLYQVETSGTPTVTCQAS
jgi:prepilin-type N-terminal cleavage/methylation domain-containing protein